MIESYAEYGAIGVIVLLFIGMIHFLKTTIFSKLQEILTGGIEAMKLETEDMRI